VVAVTGDGGMVSRKCVDDNFLFGLARQSAPLCPYLKPSLPQPPFFITIRLILFPKSIILSLFMMLLLFLAALLPALTAAASIQQPIIASPDPFSNDYTILTHESHPNHKLRVLAHTAADDKDVHLNDAESISKYCAGATSGYTGYLSTENDTKHFYFAYFESRTSPEDDPLLMWINGGPGCSSMMGLLMEQGMCLTA
jgi:hypothetical protein